MKEPERKNLAASVRQRLLNHSAKTKQDFQVVLAQYGFERLLYRLGQSTYAGQFTLKGALMFLVWTGEQYRPTRDMDLMSKQKRTAEELTTVFRDICKANVPDDGIVLLDDTVRAESIRDDDEYGGMRVTLTGKLGQARIPIQIDIGFGDAVTPKAVAQDFPSLLDFAAPHIPMYPRETAIAEKFHTIVVRGVLNSRKWRGQTPRVPSANASKRRKYRRVWRCTAKSPRHLRHTQRANVVAIMPRSRADAFRLDNQGRRAQPSRHRRTVGMVLAQDEVNV